MAVHLLDRGSRIRPRREEHGALSLLRHLDLTLVSATVAVSAFGLVMLYSATRTKFPLEPTYYVKHQLVYMALGFALMALCASIDYRRLNQWGYPIYGLVVLSLLAVFAVGKSLAVSSGGGSQAQRWLPFGSVHLQPSEFGVLAVMIALGVYATRHEGQLGARRVAAMLGLAAVPMILIFKQPDLGTTIVLTVTVAALLVFAGIRLRLLALALVVVGALVAVSFAGHLLHSYQLSRLTCFLHPGQNAAANCGYQLSVSEQAIGAGGLRGTGLFNGAVTNLQYVPEQYADTIFSAVGEQTGFVGGAVLLGLFALMALRMLRAMQMARDVLGRLLCGGALIFLVFSVFQNIGMNIGIMPITGIPLPFVSYGGSALLAFFAAVGLVLNVEMRRYRQR
ncbi:MAG: rod shape-determining protein RodA [Acidimicrobiaceae bacterium]|nr:rod shape-determining protein RodA [Acidimicrobiaceae bacterium]